MIVSYVHQCNYCRSSIIAGQRWVREKIYAPELDGRNPGYHHYHAEPFVAEEGSCWEKHQLARETTRAAA